MISTAVVFLALSPEAIIFNHLEDRYVCQGDLVESDHPNGKTYCVVAGDKCPYASRKGDAAPGESITYEERNYVCERDSGRGKWVRRASLGEMPTGSVQCASDLKAARSFDGRLYCTARNRCAVSGSGGAKFMDIRWFNGRRYMCDQSSPVMQNGIPMAPGAYVWIVWNPTSQPQQSASAGGGSSAASINKSKSKSSSGSSKSSSASGSSAKSKIGFFTDRGSSQCDGSSHFIENRSDKSIRVKFEETFTIGVANPQTRNRSETLSPHQKMFVGCLSTRAQVMSPSETRSFSLKSAEFVD